MWFLFQRGLLRAGSFEFMGGMVPIRSVPGGTISPCKAHVIFSSLEKQRVCMKRFLMYLVLEKEVQVGQEHKDVDDVHNDHLPVLELEDQEFQCVVCHLDIPIRYILPVFMLGNLLQKEVFPAATHTFISSHKKCVQKTPK